jgi:hypothetical protein
MTFFDYFFGMDAPNYPPYTYIENDKIKMFKECNKMQAKLEDEISLRL